MFILRKIKKSDNTEMNFVLGEAYTLVLQDRSPDTFIEASQFTSQTDNLYGVIHSDTGSHCLWSTHHNYIVCSNGQTFSNVSLK